MVATLYWRDILEQQQTNPSQGGFPLLLNPLFSNSNSDGSTPQQQQQQQQQHQQQRQQQQQQHNHQRQQHQRQQQELRSPGGLSAMEEERYSSSAEQILSPLSIPAPSTVSPAQSGTSSVTQVAHPHGQTRTSKASATFARLAGTLVGSNTRPSSSAGFYSGAGGFSSAGLK